MPITLMGTVGSAYKMRDVLFRVHMSNKWDAGEKSVGHMHVHACRVWPDLLSGCPSSHLAHRRNPLVSRSRIAVSGQFRDE